MRPIWKLLAISALVVSFAAGFGRSAPASAYMRFEAVGTSPLCGCCPESCGGGTYFGCWSSVDHPKDAVTCIYQANGKHFNCLSCINDASAAVSSASELP